MSSVEMRTNTSCVNWPFLLCLFYYLLMDQRGTLDNRWKISLRVDQGLWWRSWPIAQEGCVHHPEDLTV